MGTVKTVNYIDASKIQTKLHPGPSSETQGFKGEGDVKESGSEENFPSRPSPPPFPFEALVFRGWT